MAGDAAPLLRIAARAGLNGTLSGGWPLKWYSVGHAVAVPCTDYPQLYDMEDSSAARQDQYQAAVAALPANFFAPFSLQDGCRARFRITTNACAGRRCSMSAISIRMAFLSCPRRCRC
jgi:hypothetical protein